MARIGAVWAALACALLAVPVGAAEPVTIDVMVPLTGPSALTGQSLQDGLRIVERSVNTSGGIRGRDVHFNVLDDQTSPQLEVQLASGLAAKGAQIILGGNVSGTCKAVLPIFAQKGPVFYCLSPAVRPPAGGYVFSAGIHPADLVAANVRYFRSRGWTRIAFLTTTDASGQEVDAAVDTMMRLPENSAVHVVAYEHFAPADISADAQIAKIKTAAPQAIVIWGVGTAIATAFHALKDTGLDVPVATSNGVMLYSSMQQYAAILPSHLYFSSGPWPAFATLGDGPVKAALARYFAAFKAAGIKPDQGETFTWDTALLAVDALRNLGPDARAQQIRDYLIGLHGFSGVNGFYDFRTGDQRGLGLKDTLVAEWRPAQNTWVAVTGPGGSALQAALR